MVKIVPLHLALHFCSTILLVKYFRKLVIHIISCYYKEHQGCTVSPGEIEKLACLARSHLDASIGRSQTPFFTSQAQSQASKQGLSANKTCSTLCSAGDTKAPGFVDGSYNTSFHLPYSPAFGSQLGPFEQLFYLIKKK